MQNLPVELMMPVLPAPACAEVRVPGSKSITNRALVLAAASDGPSTLCNVLQSEDTEMMVRCLQGLGVQLDTDWDQARIHVQPCQGELLAVRNAELFVGNSGTTMRFLCALLAADRGRFRLDGVPRMRERPIQDLIDALTQLGVTARSERGNGCPPVVIDTSGLRGGHIHVRGDVSSQFLSALLMAAPLAKGDLRLDVDGPLVSEPYVRMTLEMMERFGVKVTCAARGTEDAVCYAVRGGQRYRGQAYAIEPDASAASYFFAAAAITGGSVRVPGLTNNSLQGDIRFVELLGQMGCDVQRDDTGLRVSGGPLHGIDADMNDVSDTVMTLAAVACFAEGPTTIRNIGHIRHKETDRLAALATELRRVGAEVEERPDGLVIQPRPLHGATIETYNDHRMAMSMSLIGLRVPGIIIKDPACVAKTYPGFWDDLFSLGSASSCR
jgi:3-phosphoshikimate 1-carboxyvinyltransferase